MYFKNSEYFLLNFRSGLKRGVFVHFNCLDSTCDHFEFELTTSCGGGGSAELPWVIECLSKSDPNFEICSLLHHDHSKRIDQMSLNLQFTSHPQLDLFIGTKKIEVDQSTMAGNSLDIKVNPILLYYILYILMGFLKRSDEIFPPKMSTWFGMVLYYENFRLYCKKIYVNMDCNWVCHDHFLY